VLCTASDGRCADVTTARSYDIARYVTGKPDAESLSEYRCFYIVGILVSVTKEKLCF
jgi:hypothetical protein